MPGNYCNGEENAQIITWRQENITIKTLRDRSGRAKSTIMKVLAASSELEPNVIYGGGMPKKISNATDGLLKMLMKEHSIDSLRIQEFPSRTAQQCQCPNYPVQAT